MGGDTAEAEPPTGPCVMSSVAVELPEWEEWDRRGGRDRAGPDEARSSLSGLGG